MGPAKVSEISAKGFLTTDRRRLTDEARRLSGASKGGSALENSAFIALIFNCEDDRSNSCNESLLVSSAVDSSNCNFCRTDRGKSALILSTRFGLS